MGTFKTTIGVGNAEGGQMQDVEVMADTGATHTVLPASLLQSLNVQPEDDVLLAFGNGVDEVWQSGIATLAYGGRRRQCPVIFCPHDEFLLGATTLEIFNLAVDPLNMQLVPTRLRGRIG